MGTPLPPPGLPNEITLPDGAIGYLNPYSGRYTRSRSYGRRMQRSYARGMSQQTGRGKRAAEHVTRRERVIAATGMTPQERFGFGFEQRYGFTYSQWRRWYRLYIRDINTRTYPTAPSSRMQVDADGQRKDPRIFPSDIANIKYLYDNGYRELDRSSPPTWEDWVETRLSERQYAMDAADEGDREVGRMMWVNRSTTWVGFMGGYVTGPAIEWWYYH